MYMHASLTDILARKIAPRVGQVGKDPRARISMSVSMYVSASWNSSFTTHHWTSQGRSARLFMPSFLNQYSIHAVSYTHLTLPTILRV